MRLKNFFFKGKLCPFLIAYSSLSLLPLWLLPYYSLYLSFLFISLFLTLSSLIVIILSLSFSFHCSLSYLPLLSISLSYFLFTLSLTLTFSLLLLLSFYFSLSHSSFLNISFSAFHSLSSVLSSSFYLQDRQREREIGRERKRGKENSG
jgi:hypothetical protein